MPRAELDTLGTLKAYGPENYTPYFLGIDKCKFRKMVIPGDTLKFKCELVAPIKRGIAQMVGYAYVGNTLVCEASMTARIVRNP